MDKITRIHIARVPYSIEPKAEANLKKYLDDIRAGLDADTAAEVMDDIESRITELLAERGVAADGVITADDVQAVEKQLGKPEQVVGSDAPPKAHASDLGTKRLLRDMDAALIGGVASGIGAYFGIDANIVRVCFLLLTFFGGFGILLYLVLWGLLPAATTGADQLHLRGQAVTVESLQRYRSIVQQTFARPRVVRQFLARVVRAVLTVVVAGLSLTLLLFLSVGTGFVLTPPFRSVFVGYHPNFVLLGLLWLGVVALIGLAATLVQSLFRQKGKRAPKIRLIAFAVGCVVAIGGIAGFAPAATVHYQNLYGSSRPTVTVSANSSPGTPIQTLHITANQRVSLNYVASSQPVHATYQPYPGMNRPDILLTANNGTLTVAVPNLVHVFPRCPFDTCENMYAPLRLTVYGPAAGKIVVDGGAAVSLNGTKGNLDLTATNGSQIYLSNGQLGQFTAQAQNNGYVNAFGSSAQGAAIDVGAGGMAVVPNTNDLVATLPEDCTDSGAVLQLPGAFPAHVIINGQAVLQPEANQNPCITNTAD